MAVIVTTVLALLLLGALLCRLRRRRCGGSLIGLGLALLLLAGCGVLPRWWLAGLQSGYPAQFDDWGQRNAIVLLGAGTARAYAGGALEPSLFAYGRIAKAAELYQACHARGVDCRIEVSGGDALGLGDSEAAVYARLLQRLGVPAAALLSEGNSMNTWQNAQFSGPLLRDYGADRILLVSSGYHLRRAGLYFAHFGVPTRPIHADTVRASIDWLPSAYNLILSELALHEYIGIVRYQWYEAMGWNVQATRPGSP